MLVVRKRASGLDPLPEQVEARFLVVLVVLRIRSRRLDRDIGEAHQDMVDVERDALGVSMAGQASFDHSADLTEQGIAALGCLRPDAVRHLELPHGLALNRVRFAPVDQTLPYALHALARALGCPIGNEQCLSQFGLDIDQEFVQQIVLGREIGEQRALGDTGRSGDLGSVAVSLRW
jgi:hypothetical protein